MVLVVALCAVPGAVWAPGEAMPAGGCAYGAPALEQGRCGSLWQPGRWLGASGSVRSLGPWFAEGHWPHSGTWVEGSAMATTEGVS